jgi:hypothetical protein
MVNIGGKKEDIAVSRLGILRYLIKRVKLYSRLVRYNFKGFNRAGYKELYLRNPLNFIKASTI